jgi:hypothetical protein
MESYSDTQKLINETRTLRFQLRKFTEELLQIRIWSERNRIERQKKASKPASVNHTELFRKQS